MHFTNVVAKMSAIEKICNTLVQQEKEIHIAVTYVVPVVWINTAKNFCFAKLPV